MGVYIQSRYNNIWINSKHIPDRQIRYHREYVEGTAVFNEVTLGGVLVNVSLLYPNI